VARGELILSVGPFVKFGYNKSESDFKKVKLDVVFPEKLAPLSEGTPIPSRRDNTGSVFSAQLMEVVSIWLFPVLLI
jgi:hypothetical protein